MNELDQLSSVCERLGASPEQARIMAAQLIKRAEQLAAERGTTREHELQKLLQLVTSGRSGEVPKDFQPPPSR